MKLVVWMSLAVCSVTLLSAQDKGQQAAGNEEKGQQMIGTVCNSQCVVKQSSLSTCDLSCTDKSGDAVFVSDKGNVKKIENQQMAMPHVGKHVKMMAVPSEKEREESLRIMQLVDEAP